MNTNSKKKYKPKIGITTGDINGIGAEVIIKVLEDTRITNVCTPIVYGSGKILTKYKRLLNIEGFNYHQYNKNSYLNEKKPNVVNCWQDNLEIEPGKITQKAGWCALQALLKSTEDLKEDFIDAIVTAPINKANVQQDDFHFPGHTEYYASEFGQNGESLMMLCSEEVRIAVVTGHIPLSEVPAAITKELVEKKLNMLLASLQQDFGITKPRVAVLGLNPHAGEEGLLGSEDNDIIAPVVSDMRNHGNLVYGPLPADGFFGTLAYKKYDAVLAMYHDQGLIPFKTIAFDRGVNFTAGLSVVRTSPDHGTAYNLAGKGEASESSLREAIFMACDIVRRRGVDESSKIRKEQIDKMIQENK